MVDDAPNTDIPRDRRQLFRYGLGRILSPLADYLQERFPAPEPRLVLRPPGALEESEFVRTCYKCGTCQNVCPAHAIRRVVSDDPDMENTPYIDPDLGACIVCENLECTKACPSGALQKLASRNEIRMGLAKVDFGVCLRSLGETCTTCVDRCPLGEAALKIDPQSRVEVQDGCVGCGVCQNVCPTNPKAITVEPR